jgi:hypothetical protein
MALTVFTLDHQIGYWREFENDKSDVPSRDDRADPCRHLNHSMEQFTQATSRRTPKASC